MSGDPSEEARGQLWHGRFDTAPAEELVAFTESLSYDQRLLVDDVACSRAHVRGLHRAGLLDESEMAAVLGALDTVEMEFRAGELRFAPSDEDVHTAIERRVTELVGAPGAKLHTGRSRNDQVATAFRRYVHRELGVVADRALDLVEVLAARADEAGTGEDAAQVPGYTHLQHAQPVLLAHHLMAHAWALLRDVDRIADCRRRTDVSPLGAGALAGSSLPLDPDATAAELGFSARFENSLDATSDRDFVAESLFVLATTGLHLSRMGEEVVLWTSQEFGWVELDDAFATGSSIMPQKKNADAAELARGKSGRLIGSLVTVLTMLKGLPLTYDRDLQEDKEPVFDAVDTLEVVLPALTGMVATMTVHADRLAAAAPTGYILATEVADWLVRRGVPFRDAHEVTGRLVARCVARGCDLGDLDDAELAEVSPHLTPQVREVLSVDSALSARTTVGSTGPEPVARQLAAVREELDRWRVWADEPVVPR